MVGCGVRTVVLLIRLVGLAYRRQFAAVYVHRVHGGILVQIQFDCLSVFLRYKILNFGLDSILDSSIFSPL